MRSVIFSASKVRLVKRNYHKRTFSKKYCKTTFKKISKKRVEMTQNFPLPYLQNKDIHFKYHNKNTVTIFTYHSSSILINSNLTTPIPKTNPLNHPSNLANNNNFFIAKKKSKKFFFIHIKVNMKITLNAAR